MVQDNMGIKGASKLLRRKNLLSRLYSLDEIAWPSSHKIFVDVNCCFYNRILKEGCKREPNWVSFASSIQHYFQPILHQCVFVLDGNKTEEKRETSEARKARRQECIKKLKIPCKSGHGLGRRTLDAYGNGRGVLLQ